MREPCVLRVAQMSEGQAWTNGMQGPWHILSTGPLDPPISLESEIFKIQKMSILF